MGYKIAVFSFNTASIGIIETMKPEVKQAHRSSYFTTWYEGMYPDFFKHLVSIILSHSPDVIVFGLQEDRYPGSYFHSHFLPEAMSKYGFTLLKQNMLMGVGITSYKNIFNLDPMTRGLSTSVYVTNARYPSLMEGEVEIREEMGGDGQDYYLHNKITRGKGATAAYIKFPDTNCIAIINGHLPFDSNSLIDRVRYNDPMIRKTQLGISNSCFNSIVENLVIKRGFTPKHVILFGDLNYRVDCNINARSLSKMLSEGPSMTQINKLVEYDELRREMKSNIYKFEEGWKDQGPIFLPTAKLIKGRGKINVTLNGTQEELPDDPITFEPAKSRKERNDTYWNTGKYGQRAPSWCDRILYRNFKDYNCNRVDDHKEIKCIYYTRFECGSLMNNSDHAGVISVLEISDVETS